MVCIAPRATFDYRLTRPGTHSEQQLLLLALFLPSRAPTVSTRSSTHTQILHAILQASAGRRTSSPSIRNRRRRRTRPGNPPDTLLARVGFIEQRLSLLLGEPLARRGRETRERGVVQRFRLGRSRCRVIDGPDNWAGQSGRRLVGRPCAARCPRRRMRRGLVGRPSRWCRSPEGWKGG